MNSNLPYFSIYKGDFLRGNVSACSIAAQGLWLRLMILMHDSERTGYLCLNGLPIPSRLAAVKCAVSVDEYETLLAELMSVSAFSTSRENIIFSPEIVAEAEERAKNADRQRKFKERKKENNGNASVTQEVTEEKQNGNTLRAGLSSSSSSSTSIKEKQTKDAATAASVSEIFEEWKTILNHPLAKLDDNRRKRIQARLSEGLHADELKRALRGVLLSPFHMGANEQKTVYTGIETIFKNRAQVEKFLALADTVPTQTPEKNALAAEYAAAEAEYYAGLRQGGASVRPH